MAKYFDPPKDYRPGLALWLRQCTEGGPLRNPLVASPPFAAAGRRELIVLVHGFNNHYGEAGRAYRGFRRCQTDRDPEISPVQLEALLGDVYWPGDAAWGAFDLVDFLVYPVAVGTARDVAPVLARYLLSLPDLLKVHFIGHSLGCRVILETVSILGRSAFPLVGRLCLMAAAVPAFKVVEGESLADAMRMAEETLVLYSPADQVLKWTFPVGQSAASGGEGFLPVALGRYGPRPGTAGLYRSEEVRGAGHSDYWGYLGSATAKKAPANVADFMHLGGCVRRVDERAIGFESLAVDARQASEGGRDIAPIRVIG